MEQLLSTHWNSVTDLDILDLNKVQARFLSTKATSIVTEFVKWHGFVTVYLAYLQLGFERYFLKVQVAQIQVQIRLTSAPSLQRLGTSPSRLDSLKTTRYFNFRHSSGKRRGVLCERARKRVRKFVGQGGVVC